MFGHEQAVRLSIFCERGRIFEYKIRNPFARLYPAKYADAVIDVHHKISCTEPGEVGGRKKFFSFGRFLPLFMFMVSGLDSFNFVAEKINAPGVTKVNGK